MRPDELSPAVLALLRKAHDSGYRCGYGNALEDVRTDEVGAFGEDPADPADSFELWLDEVTTRADLAELEHVEPPSWRQRIAVDFDGVLHAYTSPWTTTLEINDGPVPGAFAWLEEVVETFDVIVHTCRLSFERGEAFHEDTPTHERVQAIRDWFRAHGLEEAVLDRLKFHTSRGKPHADVYLDDRGLRFSGTFPSVWKLQRLVPWNKLEKAQPSQGYPGLLGGELDEATKAALRQDYGLDQAGDR